MRLRPHLALGFAALLLAALPFTSAQAHQGMQSVIQLVQRYVDTELRWVRTVKDGQEVRDSVATTLAAGPLTVYDVIDIALLNNPGLQASYNELAIDKRPFEQDLYLTAQAVIRLAADVSKAFFHAVAAAQIADFTAQALAAADAQAELARRMNEVGNWGTLEYGRYHIAYAEAAATAAKAALAATTARENLGKLMGVAGTSLTFTLAQPLPLVPKRPMPADGLDRRAMADRLDIQALRFEIETQRSILGLGRVTGILDLAQDGRLRAANADEMQMMFAETALPIFDWTESTEPKAEFLYMSAVHRLADRVIETRAQLRAAYATYRTAFDLAHHHRSEIMAVYKRMSEESLLFNNGMLNSTFDLLNDRRAEISAVIAAIEADRDFFLAETALRYAPITDVGGIVMPPGETEAAPHSHGGPAAAGGH